jgi:parallel beta-helix repeat protein
MLAFKKIKVNELKKILFISIMFTFFLFPIFIRSVYATTYISSCQELSIPGETYILTSDIIDSSDVACFNITADNVVLDCQNHIVDGVGAYSTYGIYVYRSSETASNITIKNCVLKEWEYGVYLYYSNKNTLFNILSQDSTVGIYLWHSSYNLLSNLRVYNNTVVSGIMVSSSFYNNLTNIEMDNVSTGIELYDSYYNIIRNVVVNNYSGRGIVFHNSFYNNATNLTLIALVTEDDHGYSGVHFSSGSKFNLLSNILTSFNDYGIYFEEYASNNSLLNIELINNFIYGLALLSGCNNNTINGIKALNNYRGIYISSNNNTINAAFIDGSELDGLVIGGYYNTIANSKIQNSGRYNLYLLAGARYNLIYNNIFNGTTYIVTTHVNYFNITKQPGTNIYRPSLGYVGGNYWTNPSGNGYSDICNDLDDDGFCDDPYQLSSNSYDFLPIAKVKIVSPTTTTTIPSLGGGGGATYPYYGVISHIVLNLNPPTQHLIIYDKYGRVVLNRMVSNGETIPIIPGEYSLEFSSLGYETKRIDLNINRTLTLSVNLKKEVPQSVLNPSLNNVAAFLFIIIIVILLYKIITRD